MAAVRSPGVQGEMSNAARLAWICASASAVFIVWIATSSSASANIGVGFFYVVPIGLAAWWGSRGLTVATVAGCVVLFNIGALIQPVTHFGLVLALRIVVFIAVAAAVSLARERLESLENSAEELEDIREALTPRIIDLPNVDVGTTFVPAEHGVSGDFFLVTNGPDASILAIVGDVVGHGPDAARLATFIRTRIATFVANTSDPAEILELANQAMADRPATAHELVSALCLRLEPGGRLTWAIAGHPPPLRLPRLEELKPVGATFLLGAEADLRLRVGQTSLGTGEGVVAFSDGATDVRRDGQMLGLDGLRRLLEPSVLKSAPELAGHAEAAVMEWTDEPLRDDLCLLALRPKADGDGASG
jgi:serine phosphatase RsbU (regulator of sigma subunit)